MIEAAHLSGLSVVLDVVYNHLGPDGNYLMEFSPFYFSQKTTDWGDAINFDEDKSGPVREFFIQNAEQWIRDYHFDGLRFDATQSIKDCGAHGEQILSAIARGARAAAVGRGIVLLSECERQFSDQIVAPPAGCGLDGMWNDDLHHSAIVRLTGKREAYYADHLGRAQEFVSAAKYGFLYQGQYYSWQHADRGTPFLHIETRHMISFLENHDQVANTLAGTHPRSNSSPRKYRAMAAYWLLTGGTPMFFMGQEYGSTRPFLYFSDQPDELRELIRKGRTDFLMQFESVRNIPNVHSLIPDPTDDNTFTSCKLDPTERNRPESLQLQRFFSDLLRIRREDPAIRSQCRATVDGAVLTEDCFILRFFFRDAALGDLDRLLLVNFGPYLELKHLPEPLLAPPAGMQWRCLWDSEQPEYGGSSAMHPITRTGWHISEECAILLIAHPRAPHQT
jgi:maltooligosyltrehalose trehalohydrolase